MDSKRFWSLSHKGAECLVKTTDSMVGDGELAMARACLGSSTTTETKRCEDNSVALDEQACSRALLLCGIGWALDHKSSQLRL